MLCNVFKHMTTQMKRTYSATAFTNITHLNTSITPKIWFKSFYIQFLVLQWMKLCGVQII